MERNGEGIRKLVNDKFDGNMNTCARVLKVTPSTISRVINGKRSPGTKLIYNVIDYCNRKDEDYRKYIY